MTADKNKLLGSELKGLGLEKRLRLGHVVAGLKEPEPPAIAKPEAGRASTDPGSRSSDIGQSVSPHDRVTARPGHPVTPSEPAVDEGRRLRTIYRNGVLKPRECFCAVPVVLFSRSGLFENTFDFMVYLYLFSKSYGFGRNTCDMGICELMTFTGLAKNSVRKSIERLTAQKWIRMIQDFEAGHVTRKWRVYSPYELGRTDHPTHVDSEAGPTGSSGDPVTPKPGSNETPTGSAADPVTGSPRDTYKNGELNTYKKLTLCVRAEPIRNYFSSPMPERKRESERQAFESLRRDYGEEDISACLARVLAKGVPSGGGCHSPMAFLAHGMAEVLALVQAERERVRRQAEAESARIEEERRQREQGERDRVELEMRELAFVREFPSEARQREVIREVCQKHGFPATAGMAARTFVLGVWHNQSNEVRDA